MLAVLLPSPFSSAKINDGASDNPIRSSNLIVPVITPAILDRDTTEGARYGLMAEGIVVSFMVSVFLFCLSDSFRDGGVLCFIAIRHSAGEGTDDDLNVHQYPADQILGGKGGEHRRQSQALEEGKEGEQDGCGDLGIAGHLDRHHSGSDHQHAEKEDKRQSDPPRAVFHKQPGEELRDGDEHRGAWEESQPAENLHGWGGGSNKPATLVSQGGRGVENP